METVSRWGRFELGRNWCVLIQTLTTQTLSWGLSSAWAIIDAVAGKNVTYDRLGELKHKMQSQDNLRFFSIIYSHNTTKLCVTISLEGNLIKWGWLLKIKAIYTIVGNTI